VGVERACELRIGEGDTTQFVTSSPEGTTRPT
jgi:hypothetical protein